MYNDARGSGAFTTSPYLHLQWRLIALDWLYQRHSCFLPRIHWKTSASSIHAAPFSQSAVIKCVFLVHFFHYSFFFHWMEILRLIPGGCSPLQNSTRSATGSKQWKETWKEGLRLFWGVLFLKSLFETMEMKYRMDDFPTLMVRRQKEFVVKMEKAQKDKTDKADHDAILMETERRVRLTTLFIFIHFKFFVLILAFCCQYLIESHEEMTISKWNFGKFTSRSNNVPGIMHV